LCGDAPTPVERLMVAQVVLATAEVNYHAAMMTQCAAAADVHLKAIDRRQDAAQRRHMTAINMLTTIQKRRPPVRATAKSSKRDAGPMAPEKSPGIAGTVPSSD
jgi:hypothetical protein